MNKLTLTKGLFAAFLLVALSFFKGSAQNTTVVNLQYDQKVPIYYDLYDNDDFIYEVIFSFEIKKYEDTDYIIFNVIKPAAILPAVRYSHLFLFSLTTSRQDLITEINKLTTTNFGARFTAPNEIARFYYTTDFERPILSIEPFDALHKSLAAKPGEDVESGYMHFKLDPDLEERQFELSLYLYYGEANYLKGAFNVVRLNLVLPDKKDDIVHETDCQALTEIYLAELNNLIPQNNFKTIESKYREISAISRRAEINNVISKAEQFLNALPGLYDFQKKIETDELLNDCLDLKNTLLSGIKEVTDVEPRVREYRSGLLEMLQVIEHCETLLSGMRSSIDGLGRQVRDNKHHNVINTLRSDIMSLNLEDDKLWEGVNRTLTGYASQTNEMIDLFRNVADQSSELDKRLRRLDAQDCQRDINQLLRELDKIRDKASGFIIELSELNGMINEGLNLTDPRRLSQIDSLRAVFRPEFYEIQNQINELIYQKRSINEQLAEVQRNETTFSASNRRSLLNEVDKLLENLEQKDQLLKSTINSLASGSNATIGSHQTANIANEEIDTILKLSNSLSSDLNRLYRSIEVTPVASIPVFRILLFIIIAAILFFGTWIYIKAIKKNSLNLLSGLFFLKNRNTQNHKPSTVQEALQNEISRRNQHRSAKVGGVTIRPRYADSAAAQLVHKGRGLSHVMQPEGKRNYYLIDLVNIWEDSMVRRVYINRNCIKKVYRFFYESCVADNKVLETGGYMVGFWDYNTEDPGRYNVSMEDFIEPGDDAIYGEYQLNFGAKIGVRLDKVIRNYKEKTGREMILTAWFHSHPGMRLFLSNHDLDVQERITNDVHKQKLLAFVIDPNTQDGGKSVFSTGIFSYKSNNLMNNNDGNMKEIKWKELYDWALSPVLPDFEGFFRVDMQTICSKSQVNVIYFNDQSIIRFSLFLDEHINDTHTVGFFTGEYFDDKQDKKRIAVIKDFKTNIDKDTKQEIVACFFTGKVNDETVKAASIPEKDRPEILLLCENKSTGLYILTKKSNKVYNSIADVKSTVSVSKLESWPTRRR